MRFTQLGNAMNLIDRISQLLPNFCTHQHTYRERRSLHGAPVMHLVCERCGHATPAMQRTAGEHLEAVRLGKRRNNRVLRPDHRVIAMDRQLRRPA